MTTKQKKQLTRIIITVILLLMIGKLVKEGDPYSLYYYLIPYFVIGYDIIYKAFNGIKNAEAFDENFLMVVATIGALALGEYSEGSAVMLFYQIGEFFQDLAIRRSRKNISELMDIRPDYAYILNDYGELVIINPDDVEIGTHIYIKVGDKIPIDGRIIKGNTTLNTSSLTGEIRPLSVKEGDEVLSGCINMTSFIEVETIREFEESTASKILDLVENASSNKSQSENFITKFAHYYTPAVVYGALALAIVPNIIELITKGSLSSAWIYRALTFLVISCPCALVISIPLSFFGGIGGASNKGILIKGSNYLEALSRCKTIVFDKTGTVTKGIFEISAYHENMIPEEKLLEYAAYSEAFSNHPIGLSIVKEYGKPIDKSKIESVEEISGQGIKARIDGNDILLGSKKLFLDNNITVEDCEDKNTIVYIAVNKEYVGHIHIADMLKKNSKLCIDELKRIGIKQTIMLTGDKKELAQSIKEELGISHCFSELLPNQKVISLEKIAKENEGAIAFVGDGINDAPAIARADVGISMGALGSDAAIEAADIVLMDDDPIKIPQAIKISRKCMRIVYENIYFAIGIKIICLILTAFGYSNMWLAIFADVGVMILAVLNALRVLI